MLYFNSILFITNFHLAHQRPGVLNLRMYIYCVARKDSRILWKARRSSQSILKEIHPKYSLERLLMKLKLQYFGHLMRTADSLEKTLVLEKIGGRRRVEQRMLLLDGITDSMDMNLGRLQEMVRDREAWHAAVHGVMNSSTWLGEWTTAYLPQNNCQWFRIWHNCNIY